MLITSDHGNAEMTHDPATGQALVDGIDEVARIFWETKGKEYAVPQSADQA